MSPRKELTDYQKGQIEGRASTMSCTEIGEELGIPRQTVSSFLQRLEKIKKIFPGLDAHEGHPIQMIDTLFMQLYMTLLKR